MPAKHATKSTCRLPAGQGNSGPILCPARPTARPARLPQRPVNPGHIGSHLSLPHDLNLSTHHISKRAGGQLATKPAPFDAQRSSPVRPTNQAFSARLRQRPRGSPPPHLPLPDVAGQVGGVPHRAPLGKRRGRRAARQRLGHARKGAVGDHKLRGGRQGQELSVFGRRRQLFAEHIVGITAVLFVWPLMYELSRLGIGGIVWHCTARGGQRCWCSGPAGSAPLRPPAQIPTAKKGYCQPLAAAPLPAAAAPAACPPYIKTEGGLTTTPYTSPASRSRVRLSAAGRAAPAAAAPFLGEGGWSPAAGAAVWAACPRRWRRSAIQSKGGSAPL